MEESNEDVWRCACGENDFRLLRDGTVVCSVCDSEALGVKVTFPLSSVPGVAA